MPELVTKCPRCNAKNITFDVLSAIKTGIRYDWQNWYEVFSRCRNCHRSTVFQLHGDTQRDYKHVNNVGLLEVKGSINNYLSIAGPITLKDMATIKAPDHVPDAVLSVFLEGAKCATISCFNAAATMFRLCIDLVTKSLIPEEQCDGLNNRTKRNLALRLNWMFDNGILPEGLRELSTCVREDGNDGAHAGTLSKEDAEDLLDFTTVLLQRIYTEPMRIQLARERRSQRRRNDA